MAFSRLTTSIAGKHNVVKDFLEIIGPNGDFQMITGINVYIKSIRNLLMTPLGTYVFDPNYGSLLHEKVFSINDDISLNEIKYEVTDRIKSYDPRIDIKNVEVIRSTSNNKEVFISILLQRDNKEDILILNLNEYDMEYSLETE